MDQLLHALAAPRRREILKVVRRKDRSAGEIHEALGDLTFGAVSQHLGVLEGAGLVSVRKDGRSRIYAFRMEGLRPLRDWVDAMWDDALARLARLAQSEERREAPDERRPRRAAERAPRRSGKGSRR
ncbi:MAG: metalloregulator ArsR/SmtB family transcription factor [Vicinamibacteria bacterium]